MDMEDSGGGKHLNISTRENEPDFSDDDSIIEVDNLGGTVVDDAEKTLYVQISRNKSVQDDNAIVSSARSLVMKAHSSRIHNAAVALSAETVVEKVLPSHKRKRECSYLLPVLKWIAHAARHSDDPAIGLIPDSFKRKDYARDGLWVQALLARRVLLIRRHEDSNYGEFPLQKKPRMHPSMYEDDNILNNQSAEGVRCSKRLLTTKSPSSRCCESCSAPCQSKVLSPAELELENVVKGQGLTNSEASNSNATNDESIFDKIKEVSNSSTVNDVSTFDRPQEKHVSVGPLFQADVPEWTGDTILEIDSKWLGTRMWSPTEHVKKNYRTKKKHISCQCNSPGSTYCVRFHIAENRMRLKLELGSLFYRWKFNRMGEEVLLSWSAEEETKFKCMVTSSPVAVNKLWRNAFKLFPGKRREQLVSYYFNVLVVRRRSYQNRVTPENIDSDDDEKEFGAVGDRFGYESVFASSRRLPMCLLNKQCTDFE